MNEALHVLCLSVEPVGADVAAVLRALPGFALTVRTADYQSGLRELRDPDLVIVALGTQPALGLTVIEEIHRSAPAARVLALAHEEQPELIVKAMRAGADELLPLPVTETALLKVCIKVAETRRQSAGQAASRGEIWVAYGAKGGVGVTTLVANLGFALRAAGRDTALVDLDCVSGDLAVFLNLTPMYTLADIAANFRRLDSVFLQGTMSRHPSGLELLAAPPITPGEPPLTLSAEQTRAILDLLRTLHAVTVVDTPVVATPATLATMAAASRVLLVTELTIPALRSALRTVDWLREEGVDLEGHVELVVNRYTGKPPEIPAAEAAKTLKLPIRACLPRDDATALAAVNGGRPIHEVRGGSPLDRAIGDLLSAQPTPADAGARRKGLLRLFSAAERGAS